MSRFIRSWGVIPALLIFLGGCLPGPEGPSIPPIPSGPAAAGRVTVRQPAIAKARDPRKMKGARKIMAKVQAAPKARDPQLEEEAE